MALTQELGRLASNMALDAIPEEARRIARMGFADCVAVMVAGSREPVAGIVARELSANGAGETASLIPSGEKRRVQDAALVNGVAAHVLDYDDVALDGHPSAALVPAILAQAEALNSTGAEMLAAYVAGYEVWAELLARLPGRLHDKGWHPTAVLGTVAAAAACARLRKLDADRTATAIALAASMSSGLVANFGTMTKSFQVGRAGQNGVVAAKLAAAGFTASPDAFEHAAGFLTAFAPTNRREEAAPVQEKREWQILRHGLNVKRYPCCYSTHRSIDAALELIESHQVRPADIERIHVATGRTQMLMLRNHRPQTGLEAKFSMEFAMASAAVARRVGLSELTDAFVRRPEIQAMMPLVTTETMDATAPGDFLSPFDTVSITLNGGRKLDSEKVAFALGSHARPLTPAQLREKFDDCLGAAARPTENSPSFEAFMRLERIGGIGELGLTSH